MDRSNGRLPRKTEKKKFRREQGGNDGTKKLTLDSYPGYLRVFAAVQKLRAEKAESSTRIEQILQELSQPREQQIDAAQAWAQALEGRAGYKYATDNRSELRDELAQLEGRLRFIDKALSVGEVELDKARGQASLEICAAIRPQWTAEIKVILECQKKISESNQRLDVACDARARRGFHCCASVFEVRHWRIVVGPVRWTSQWLST
jgi:hypothetical protein